MKEDTAYVQIFDPVLLFIKTDSDRDKKHKYVTMSMAVGSIATMSNKTVGSGALCLMPEQAFATEETKVEVNLVKVSAAAGGDDFLELHTDHYLTAKPLLFQGNEFVLLVKPQVVETEAGQQLYRLKKKDLERHLSIFAELFEDLRDCGSLPQKLPQGPSKVLPEPVGKRMWLEKLVSKEFECDLCNNPKSVMLKKDMRVHSAGHSFKGGYYKVVGKEIMFERPCGYCGVSVAVGGCTLDIRTTKQGKRVVASTCGKKLDHMKFAPLEKERNEELERRIAAAERKKDAAAAAAAEGEDASAEGNEPMEIKLNGFPVANIPVVCPMDGCLNVVWRDELLPHVLNEHVSLDGQRNQQWRRRGKSLVVEFIHMLSDVKGRKDERDYEMKAETEARVLALLEEMRQLVPGKLGITLAFALEQMARESSSALKAFARTRKRRKTRNTAKRKRKQTVEGGAKGVEEQEEQEGERKEADDGVDDDEGTWQRGGRERGR